MSATQAAIRPRHVVGLTREASSWPRTSRVLPWSLAAFMVMLWITPFDALQLPFSLGVDSKLDRLVVGIMVMLWLAVVVGSPRGLRPARRRSPFGVALALWIGVLMISLVANAELQSRLGAFDGGVKALSLVLSWAIVYGIVSSTLTVNEVPAFLNLLLGLATIMAVGVIVQYRTGTNPFFEFAKQLPGLRFSAPPESQTAGARATITGPTSNGLAVCAMLGAMVPWAVVGLLDSKTRGRQITYAVAGFLLFVGVVSTQRKAAVVIPLGALFILFYYRPVRLVRLAPLAVVLILGTQVVAPGGLSGIRYQFGLGGSSSSTQGRTEDYPAVAPEILRHPFFGRGYGTYSAATYRYLDNQLLGLAVSTGIAGLLTFLGLLATAIVLAHRSAMNAPPERAGPASALAAGLAALAGSMALFDGLAFRHVPYLLFVLAAMVTVLARPSTQEARDGA